MRRDLLHRVSSGLRSRRLAAALIVALAGYSIVASLVPRGPADEPAVREWAAAHPVAEWAASILGLHQAFASPLFLSLIALLAMATGACAVDRTRHSLRMLRNGPRPTRDFLDRLRDRPQHAFALDPSTDPGEVMGALSVNMRRLRLRVGPVTATEIHGRGGLAGPFGSTTFHWTILAVILVAGFGQAYRAEGLLGLPVGERVTDARSSYLRVDEGPLFAGRFSGVDLVASDVQRHYMAGGVDRGAAPVIAVSRDGEELARGRVYPNQPLRLGSLLLHSAGYGPAVVLVVGRPPGGEVARTTVLLDRSTEDSSAGVPRVVRLGLGADAPPIAVRVSVAPRAGAGSPGHAADDRAYIETSTVGSGRFGERLSLAVGESLALPGGSILRVAEVKDWALVSLTNDWSVPLLYALFVVLVIGLAVAVLVPTRLVSAMLVQRDDGSWWLHLRAWHSRRDPIFEERVDEAVRAAIGAEAA